MTKEITRKKVRYHKLTAEDYRKVKVLVDAKLSLNQISEVVGRSTGTVSLLKRATSFEDYQRTTREYLVGLAAKKKLQAGEQSEVGAGQQGETTPPTTPTAQEDNSYQKELLYTLRSINTNLERLANAWETKPNGKSFLHRFSAPKKSKQNGSGLLI